MLHLCAYIYNLIIEISTIGYIIETLGNIIKTLKYLPQSQSTGRSALPDLYA